MNPLRSGQNVAGQWRRVNEQGNRGQFTADQMIGALHSINGHRQRVLIAGAPVAGWVLCGEYDPNRTYSMYNVVQRTLGANRGTWIFISTTPSTGSSGANPTVDPWVNSNGSWMEFFPGNSNDQWQ